MAKTRVTGKVDWFDGTISSNGITTMTAGGSAPTIGNQRRGARSSSMAAPGRSGRVKALAAEYYHASPGDGIFTLEGWFAVKSFGQTTGSNISAMFGGHRAAGQIMTVGHQASGELIFFDASNGNTSTGSFLTRCSWVYLSMLVNHAVAAGISGYGCLRMNQGGSSLSYIHNRSASSLGGQTIDRFQFLNGLLNGNDLQTWTGMVSALSLYQLGSLADATLYPSDVVQPPTEAITIYTGANGATTNDGDISTPLPNDATRINDEIYYNFLDHDMMVIDNTSLWDIGANSVVINTLGASGNYVTFLGPKTNRKMHKDITNVTWTQYDSINYPNIWQTTDSNATDLNKIVVWEDDVAMTHPVGAAIANVRVALNAAPGFWTDGTTIFVHTTGDVSPSASGKTYIRSRDRINSLGQHGCPALEIIATNLRVFGWGSRYLSYVDHDNNDGMQFFGATLINDGCSGYIECHEFDQDWTGKHFGSAVLYDGMTVKWKYPRIGRGYPYGAAGSATTFADQSSDNSTTAVVEYTMPSAVSGSDYVFWISHNAQGVSGHIATATFDRPMIPGKTIDNTGGCTTVVNIIRGLVGSAIGDASATMNVSSATQISGTESLTTRYALGSRSHQTIHYNTNAKINPPRRILYGGIY